MEPVLVNANFEETGLLDTFESLIWTDKYAECGDFEITLPISPKIMSDIIGSPYLKLKESEHLMLIESFNIHTEVDVHTKIIITGRSLEIILSRRIILNKTVLKDNFQDAIQRLLNENAISPTVTERTISKLEFEASTDPIITAFTIDAEFEGDNLYSAIVALCAAKHIGFKVTLTDAGKFRFKLYAGVDRSYDQVDIPYVIFSPKFDNTITGDYTFSDLPLKTVGYVAGEEGVGNKRKMIVTEAPDGAKSDLERREMYVDARNVSRNVTEEGQESRKLTNEEYDALLQEKGVEALAKSVPIESFEGQIDATRMFIYGEDFYMGDIVQVANEYGNEAKSRVAELIHSQDSSGTKIYPTFSAVI